MIKRLIKLSAVSLFLLFSINSVKGLEMDVFGFSVDEYSSWAILDADFPNDGDRGAFAVGNGIVFAYLGVHGDFNVMKGVTGPGYQPRTKDGKPIYWVEDEWGEQAISLFKAGRSKLNWRKQSIKRLRGIPIVHVEQKSNEGVLHSLTFAPPGQNLIVRMFILRGGKLARALKCAVVPNPNDLSHWKRLPDGSYEVARNGKKMVVLALGNLRIREDGGWWIDAVSRGQTVSFTIIYEFIREGKPSRKNLVVPQSLLDQTLQYWRKWNEDNITFETPNKRLNDLMNELPMIIEVQRDAYSGAVSPMVSYHGFWIRDSNGPILTLLANGKYGEVRKMLEYYRKVSNKLRSFRMLIPLDEQVGEENTKEGSETNVDFSTFQVERAEVPSWIILQHYWYFRYSGDKKFVSKALPMLERNLFGMPIDEKFGASFHGDETYTHGALYSTYDRLESGSIGYPNGYIPTDFFSLDNTLIHREAAYALEEIAKAVGRLGLAERAHGYAQKLTEIIKSYRLKNGIYAPAISSVTSEKWFKPFSNISLRKYWLWLSPSDEDGWKDYVWTRDEVLSKWKYGSTPYSGYSTGHNLGYFLIAAGALNAHEGELLLDRLIKLATPEGAWCEVYSPEGKPVTNVA